MNRFKTIFFLLTITLFTSGLKAQTIIAGTYNVRLETTSDVGNLWKDRHPYVASLIQFHDFDILGTQEAFKPQLDDLLRLLPAYSYYGLGRDDGESAGEHSAILYKTDKFTLLDKGDFWLSETPEKPSLGWDATCCKRICSWVYLRLNKTKQTFYVFNAHYDHQGVEARNCGIAEEARARRRDGRGAAPALTDLRGGQIQLFFDAPTGLIQAGKSGRVRLIGVSSDKRSSQLPQVATIAESGFPGFRTVTWNGLMAPAGTPPAVVQRVAKSGVQPVRLLKDTVRSGRSLAHARFDRVGQPSG